MTSNKFISRQCPVPCLSTIHQTSFTNACRLYLFLSCFIDKKLNRMSPQGDHRRLNLTGLDIMCHLSLLKSAIKYQPRQIHCDHGGGGVESDRLLSISKGMVPYMNVIVFFVNVFSLDKYNKYTCKMFTEVHYWNANTWNIIYQSNWHKQNHPYCLCYWIDNIIMHWMIKLFAKQCFKFCLILNLLWYLHIFWNIFRRP